MLAPSNSPIPQINVVVQQPPGWPMWATTLLSAFVGALFGVISNLATEYAKPFLQKRQLKRLVKNQINDEFAINLSRAQACLRIVEVERPRGKEGYKDASEGLQSIFERFKRDRYDSYFVSNKEIVYDIDCDGILANFYNCFAERPTTYPMGSLVETELWLDRLCRIGGTYVSEACLDFVPHSLAEESVYMRMREAEEHGRRSARPNPTAR